MPEGLIGCSKVVGDRDIEEVRRQIKRVDWIKVRMTGLRLVKDSWRTAGLEFGGASLSLKPLRR